MTAGRRETGVGSSVMGLAWRAPIGLAAGFDRDGTLVPFLDALGLGFAELGTVTPRAEPGHNLGVAVLAANLARARSEHPGPWGLTVGVSIGKNTDTPPPHAAEDYVACLRSVWDDADYVTVNLSAPNARYLLRPEHAAGLLELLEELRREQAVLAARTGRRVPLAVKLGLDPSAPEIPPAVHAVKRLGFEGLVAAIGPRDWGDETTPAAQAMVRAHAVRSVRALRAFLGDGVSLISVGAAVSPEDVGERLEAGAALVQVYRGLLHDPSLARRTVRFLRRRSARAARPGSRLPAG